MKELHNSMVEQYHIASYNNNYILCYPRKGVIYGAIVENVSCETLKYLSYVEKRAKGYSLRYRPNREQQEFIERIAKTVKPLCSLDYLEKERANYNNNRGALVETLCARIFGGTLASVKNLPFTDGGDITINYVQYQIKYGARTGGATFTTEETLYNIYNK